LVLISPFYLIFSESCLQGITLIYVNIQHRQVGNNFVVTTFLQSYFLRLRRPIALTEARFIGGLREKASSTADCGRLRQAVYFPCRWF
jgi:hypothetical protein